jgi:hypothetical protein
VFYPESLESDLEPSLPLLASHELACIIFKDYQTMANIYYGSANSKINQNKGQTLPTTRSK